MKRILSLLVLLFAVGAFAAEPVFDSLKFQGFERTYYLYKAENPLPQNPVVICCHGYGGKAEGYKPDFVARVLESGFSICVPQGLKAPKGKTGWNVRYPKQEGLKADDVAFIMRLRKHLVSEYGFSASNVFFCGMSNGGEMCYLMAYTHPEAFGAIASMAGLQMDWIVRELKPRGPVPFMEVHGTGDKTSRWEGDPTNEFGWGKYLAVPSAISNMVSINKCTVYSKEEFDVVGNPVVYHHFTGGLEGSEVRFYEVVGGGHSWAEKDFDSYGSMLAFFKDHLK